MDFVKTARRYLSRHVRRTALDLLWGLNASNWAWKVLRGCRVLGYHTVGPERGPFDQGQRLSISAKHFEQHLEYFRDNFHVVPLEELFVRQTNGQTVDGCLALTFDDGYQSLFECGIPLLAKYRMPCTVFLCTAFLDNRDVSWPLKLNYLQHVGASDVYIGLLCRELRISAQSVGANIVQHAVDCVPAGKINGMISRAFREAGIDEAAVCQKANLYVKSDAVRNVKSEYVAFGNHTHTHPVMGMMTLDAQRAEMETSHRILREDLGLTGFLPFAFPFGRPGMDFTQESVRIVRDSGYGCICAASVKYRAGAKMGCVNRTPISPALVDDKMLFGSLTRIIAGE